MNPTPFRPNPGIWEGVGPDRCTNRSAPPPPSVCHNPPVRFSLSFLLLCCACWVEPEGEEFDLRTTPFSNAWLARGFATMEVSLAEGYTCPDGREGQVWFVDPQHRAEGRPLALLFHGDAFDHENAAGEHWEGVDRLRADAAVAAVENLTGIREPYGTLGAEGAWVAALLEAGYSLAIPANCWGDLWHGRGDNDSREGFLRFGAYLAHDAARLASARFTPGSVVAIGLGDGGRAVTELLQWPTSIAAAAIDGSPDWLPPALAEPAFHTAEIEGWNAIWHGDLEGIDDPAARLTALQAALTRDSLVHAVTPPSGGGLGIRVPIACLWSSLDPDIDPAYQRQSCEAVNTYYSATPESYRYADWAVAENAPSNRDIAQARDLVGWMSNQIGWVLP